VGTALFADISVFMLLTEALERTPDACRSVGFLTRQMNQTYGALIAEVEARGGSVLGLACDALTHLYLCVTIKNPEYLLTCLDHCNILLILD